MHPGKPTSSELAALAKFWQVYEAAHERVSEELYNAAAAMPEFAGLLASMDPVERVPRRRASLERLRRAMVDGEWAPFLRAITDEAAALAHAGIDLPLWYELSRQFRRAMLVEISRLAADDSAAADLAVEGLSLYQEMALQAAAGAFTLSSSAAPAKPGLT
jgi:hypothetical protein